MSEEVLRYKRSHFVTQLPVNCRYSPSHFWLRAGPDGVWRVGFTRFATRMLGDIVDHAIEKAPMTPVTPGQVVGWIEGFKAISDLFCVLDGTFLGGNPELAGNVSIVGEDNYGRGWLYEVKGEPDPQCVDVHAYRDLLDRTIDRMLEKQRAEAEPS
ncbi:MAG: glycine cleavage system protein H [Verrucomicrobiae bacterium]|nr:glycine cleavage system protein H [Verrucomicrobiae bacterium]